MRYILLFISLISPACSAPKYDAPEEMVNIIKTIEEQYKIDLSIIKFDFIDEFPDEPRVAAKCYPSIRANIKYSKKHWDSADESKRLTIMIHEVGHCYFRRPHKDDLYNNGCPTSIMIKIYYPKYFQCFRDNWEYYLKEMGTKPLTSP